MIENACFSGENDNKLWYVVGRIATDTAVLPFFLSGLHNSLYRRMIGMKKKMMSVVLTGAMAVSMLASAAPAMAAEGSATGDHTLSVYATSTFRL